MRRKHRDSSIHIERVLCVMFLRTFIYRPKIAIVITCRFGVRSRIFLFPKTVQDKGNKSAHMCLVILAVGKFSIYVNTTISLSAS